MSTNKFISYILCNKGIIVNLYKLHFSSFSFSFQPNKRVFYPPTFLPLQLNTQEKKLNIFHPPTFPLLHLNRPLMLLLLLVYLFIFYLFFSSDFSYFILVQSLLKRKEKKKSKMMSFQAYLTATLTKL